MVNKGKVTDIINGGAAVIVKPYKGETVTPALAVPFFLAGALPIDTPVVYVTFEDNTGVVLSRMDGEWNHSLQVIEGG